MKIKKNKKIKKMRRGQPAIVTHFITAYHIFLVKVQTNYCNNNLPIQDVKQLNKIIKHLFHDLKALLARVGTIGSCWFLRIITYQNLTLDLTF